jgi:CMP-N-acetylneuraminic acid synthetase
MTGDKMLPYIMNQNDVIDIDTKLDLEFARFFLGAKK